MLLGLAAVLVLLALAPASAAYTFGPRVGHVFAEARIAFVAAGAALALGVLAALVLAGST